MNNCFHCAFQKNKPSSHTATAVVDCAGSPDVVTLQKELVLDGEITLSANIVHSASVSLSFDITIL